MDFPTDYLFSYRLFVHNILMIHFVMIWTTVNPSQKFLGATLLWLKVLYFVLEDVETKLSLDREGI